MAPLKPTKYTPERTKRLLDAVAMGATRTLACKYAGITIDTLGDWEKKYPAFKASMVEAEGRAGIGWLAKIEKAANDGDWRAAAYKLEKLYPDEYGKTVQEQRHAGAGGAALTFTLKIDRREADADSDLRTALDVPEAGSGYLLP